MRRFPGQMFLILSCFCYSFEWWMIAELHKIGVTSYEIAFYKGFFVVLLIGIYLFARGKFQENKATLEKKHVIPLAIFSLIFLYGNIAYAVALEHTKIMNIITLMYLSVFLGIISGSIFFAEKIRSQIILYAFLAFTGIVLTLSTGDYALHFGLGEFLAITIAFTLTASTTIVKYTPELNTWFRLFVAYTFGTVVLFLIILSNSRLEFLFSTPLALGMGALYAIATGLLGRGLKDLGTKHVPMSQVAIIMLLEPVLQITTAGIFGGQIPTGVNMIGMLLVFFSVIGVSMRRS